MQTKIDYSALAADKKSEVIIFGVLESTWQDHCGGHNYGNSWLQLCNVSINDPRVSK